MTGRGNAPPHADERAAGRGEVPEPPAEARHVVKQPSARDLRDLPADPPDGYRAAYARGAEWTERDVARVATRVGGAVELHYADRDGYVTVQADQELAWLAEVAE